MGGGGIARVVYIIVLAILVLLLCFFKYYNYFIDESNSELILAIYPLGLSFFVFSCISYLTDVLKGYIENIYTVREICLYLFFFPKLLQGPIEKADKFLMDLKSVHTINRANFVEGMQIFLFGLIKKLVIADRLGLFVDTVYSSPISYDGGTLLLLVITYPVQLYCDFSGYSDMAIGVSKVLGYNLSENFNLPFASGSVTEYWRRWHVTLGNWFKEYVYIPLGGNRVGKNRQILNLLVVWILTGVWHGSTWSFLIWGLYNFAIVIFEKMTNIPQKIPRFYRVVTLILVAIGWIWFRSPNISTAIMILKGIVQWKVGITYIYTWALIYVALTAVITCIGYKRNTGTWKYLILDMSKFASKLVICITVIMTLILMYVGNNYFLYFNF